MADEAIYAPPAIAVDPIDEIVAATAGFNAIDGTIAKTSANKINVALYHIETLRQLMPDLSNWSQDRAEAVNDAIAAMEAALKGREEEEAPFSSLRQTVAAAKKDPRDIDVMIALSDRSKDIEDLLAAHDKYSIGIRTALIDLKPLAVEYIRMPKRRTTTARKSTSARSRSTASKTTTAAKRSTTTKPATTAKTAAASKTAATARTTTTSKTTGTASTRKTSARAASTSS